LRASQEGFWKENLQLTPSDCAEEKEHTGRGEDCKTHGSNVNLEIPNDDKHHEFECNVDGRYGFAEKSYPTEGNFLAQCPSLETQISGFLALVSIWVCYESSIVPLPCNKFMDDNDQSTE